MSRKPKIKIKKLNEEAEIPSLAHDSDSGYDLKITGIHSISGDVIKFKTGISVQPPKNYYFELYPRSSMSKYPLSLANSVGVIDNGYTGEIIIPVRVMHQFMGKNNERASYPEGIVSFKGLKPNTLKTLADMIIDQTPKLFQLILRKKIDFDFEIIDDLQETQRSSGGFGSTD